MVAKHTRYLRHLLDREDFDAVTVVRLRGKAVDDETLREIFGSVYSLVSDSGRHHLVLNLARLSHLPSMGLGKLVMLSRKVQAAEGRLALCRLSPIVEQTLEATHLEDLFDVFYSERAAVQSLAAGTTAGRAHRFHAAVMDAE